jgi:hypothetical protein
LKNLDVNLDINRGLENIAENMKIWAKEGLGHYKLRCHKSWIGKEYSKLLHQELRHTAVDVIGMNGNNMDTARSEGAGLAQAV